MNSQQDSLHTLQDIRRMMDQSSRFISLSGWSGIAAGICALLGAWRAHSLINDAAEGNKSLESAADHYNTIAGIPIPNDLGHDLFHVALLTFGAALASALFFTQLRSLKTKVPLWGAASRRLLLATAIPMLVGAIFLINLMHAGVYTLLAPGCLLFYGLALLNASKYTMIEIRWLGYAILLTGLVSLSYPGKGLQFWAFGFGILHIAYGIMMWWRHEKKQA